MKKVAIIGFGNIGKALTFRLLDERYPISHLCIIDNSKFIDGAHLDMLDASMLHTCEISINNSLLFESCDTIFHCAGASVPGSGDRLSIASENVRITKEIFHEFRPLATAKIIVITNPVDIITYYTWKYSGLEHDQVVGTGTLLDTMRLNRVLRKSGYQQPEGLMLGEHGSTMFISKSLSKVNRLLLTDQVSEQTLEQILTEVKQSAKKIKETQSATVFGVTEAALHLFHAVHSEESFIMPVSSKVSKEISNGNKPIYVSQLCSVSRSGISPQKSKLHIDDRKNYQKSILTLRECIHQIE